MIFSPVFWAVLGPGSRQGVEGDSGERFEPIDGSNGAKVTPFSPDSMFSGTLAPLAALLRYTIVMHCAVAVHYCDALR